MALKLQTKLTLFNTISKLAIVLLFVFLLPMLIKNINHTYNDGRFRKQEAKLLQIVKDQGIGVYIQNGEGYGAYLPLKEEYILLDEADSNYNLDTIRNEKRKVEKDTIEYRILSHTFKVGNKNYLLEIGKSVSTLDETSGPLQSIALQILLGMIMLTILADFFFSNYILGPLDIIIKTKLIAHKFPNFGSYQEVKTSTADFKYLDKSIHQMIETIESTFQKEREFISNASHELMTPISILQSKIENMFNRDDVVDELKIRLIEMQKILNRLKSITKTLLLISQIENEQFIKDDTIQIKQLLQDVYDEISIRLEEKDIALNMNITDDVALQNVNKFLLYNLFFNLINNAIKYNKEAGEININSYIHDGTLVVEILDSGIGISAEQLPFIFNRFKKFRQSLQQESFGLGLPIVKSIADFHKIRINVTSQLNVGSTFTLVFPNYNSITQKSIIQ
ncbi:signal transduction histidine kinase [Mucilaginibacter gracilis]|uniref:histidine kinase n=1 Tax=Mucilaginibacter gracilis TaxID=423350 RepID=A0A495J904_9SPHI|nr:HAMP domain-containing sensor histidine kinase [Mucilaginibacter gracilis]RKR85496.1 signal transduction histidine kinase [Mucilaginibacter gracilis]